MNYLIQESQRIKNNIEKMEEDLRKTSNELLLIRTRLLGNALEIQEIKKENEKIIKELEK